MASTTDWFDHEPAEVTGPIASSPSTIPTEFDSKPQWGDDGSGGLVELDGYEAGEVTALSRLMENVGGTSSNHTLNEFSTVGFNNNWHIRSHWLWNDIFIDHYKMDVGRFVLVDDTGRTWRNARSVALMNEWEAANPGKFVSSFEWESDDNVGVLGSWSDRRILFTPTAWLNGGWEVEYANYEAGTGDFPFRQTVPVDAELNPLRPSIAAYAPDFSATTAPLGWSGATSELHQWQWSPNDVLPYHVADLNVGEPEVEIVIPDATFEDRAIPLTVPLGFGGIQQHTNGMVVVALPRLHELVDPERVYEATLPIANPRRVSLYHPPRWRVTYFTDEVPVTPYRRNYPRDDGLAGGARRNYPPSKATQYSNRTTGYL